MFAIPTTLRRTSLKPAVKRPVYRACQLPERLGMGKTKLFQIKREAWFPKPSGLGDRTKVWTEEQIVKMLESRRLED